MANEDDDIIVLQHIEYLSEDPEQERERKNIEEELMDCVKGVLGDLPNDESDEDLSDFINSITRDENNEASKCSTLFHKSKAKAPLGSLSNDPFLLLPEQSLKKAEFKLPSMYLKESNVTRKNGGVSNNKRKGHVKSTRMKSQAENVKHKIYNMKSRKTFQVPSRTQNDMNYMNDLFEILKAKCFSDAVRKNNKFVSQPRILDMAIMTLKMLKTKENEKNKEKKRLKEVQVNLLTKLITLLKEQSTMNKNTCELETNTDQVKKAPKFDFCGFRSSKPMKWNRNGPLDVSKMFDLSPPPSPTPSIEGLDDLSPSVMQDPCELNYVFHPTKEALASLRKGTTEKAVSHLEEPHTNPKNRKNLKSTTIHEKRSLTHNNQTTMEKTSTTNKRNQALARRVTKRNHPASEARLRQIKKRVTILPPSDDDVMAPLLGSVTPDKASPAKLSISNSSPSKEITISSKVVQPTTKKGGRVGKKRKFGARAKKQVKHLQAQTRRNAGLAGDSSFTPTENTNVIQTSTKATGSTVPAPLHTNNTQMSGLDNCDLPNSGSKRKIVNQQPTLYYPVHPYTSPNLPVHFIPIDANNIPDFIPLYYPSMGMKNTTEVYPSFVRVTANNNARSGASYVLGKQIQSNSIPRQTMPPDLVLPRTLPSVLPISRCPVIPEVSSVRMGKKSPAVSNTLTGTKVSSRVPMKMPQLQPKPTSLSFNSQTHVNGIIRSRATEKKEHVKPPSSASTSIPTEQARETAFTPLNGQTKIHKCPKCPFESPKLGVLKRHQLTHSQGESMQSANSPPRQKPLKTSPSSVQASVTIDKTVQENANVTDISFSSPSKRSGGQFLKNTSNRSNNFHGFSEAFSTVSIGRKLPGVTITPLVWD